MFISLNTYEYYNVRKSGDIPHKCNLESVLSKLPQIDHDDDDGDDSNNNDNGARVSVMVEALCHMPEGHGF
jgi:hypothetical protein